MRIVSLCMNRPVTVLMAVAAVMVFGIVSYQNLQVDLFQTFYYDVVRLCFIGNPALSIVMLAYYHFILDLI